MEKYKREIEQLEKGHDNELRSTLSREIEEIIRQSNTGEIGLAGFIEEINGVLATARELSQYFNQD